MAAEAEHGHRDEGVGGFEAEGDAGDEPDLGVDRPLDRPCSIAARIDGVCATMLFCSLTNAGIRHRRAQPTHTRSIAGDSPYPCGHRVLDALRNAGDHALCFLGFRALRPGRVFPVHAVTAGHDRARCWGIEAMKISIGGTLGYPERWPLPADNREIPVEAAGRQTGSMHDSMGILPPQSTQVSQF